MKQFLISICIFMYALVCPLIASGQKTEIRNAVNRMLHDYPASTLQDMYKSFFQDQFGLGHLVSDSISARDYLMRELEESEEFQSLDFEPTGYKGNFQRVSLSLIKSGRVSFEDYFRAFMRSAETFTPVSQKKWEREWRRIIKVIEKMNLSLPDYEIDKKNIESLLRSGQYATHHSTIYNQTYHPHYRLIKTDLARELLP